MYVIAGVTGHTGKVAAEALLEAKKPVRIIVRNPEVAAEWRARGADVAITDLDDIDALTAALRGTDGAYLLLPPQPASTDARADNAQRTEGLARAIEASGVPHVVFLSSIGAHLPGGTGPILSLHDAERTLRKLRADITFVRASYFMENWRSALFALPGGVLPSFLRADRQYPMIATRDIGTTVAGALLEGGHGKSVIELTGPREYSAADVAEALGRVVAKPVRVEIAPEEAMIGALTAAGLNAHWAGLYQEMTRGFNQGHVTFEGGSARSVRGTTPIEEVLRQLVA